MTLVELIKKGSLHGLATATPATVATIQPQALPTVATIATFAVATAQYPAANDPQPDTDRWCWPHSTAMNTMEIDTFTVRLARFTDKGLDLVAGELLADKLVIRDRDKDDRAVCLECIHLGGYGATSWRCANWQAAGIAIRARDAPLAVALVCQLQRCEGFANAPTPMTNCKQIATAIEGLTHELKKTQRLAARPVGQPQRQSAWQW